MRKKQMIWCALASMVAAPMVMPAPANAEYWRNGHHYRGSPHHYRHKCGGGNGAVGTIAGGVGGGLIGNALIGGPVGVVAGAVGGGLLGRHLDKKHTRHVNGC